MDGFLGVSKKTVNVAPVRHSDGDSGRAALTEASAEWVPAFHTAGTQEGLFLTEEDSATRDCVQFLQASFPGVQISFGELSDEDAVRDFAVSAGSGRHLVLSHDFLNWMSSGKDAFLSGMDMIGNVLQRLSVEEQMMAAQGRKPAGSGAVIDRSGEAALWMVPPEEQKKEESPEEKMLKDMLDSLKRIDEMREKNRKKHEEEQKKLKEKKAKEKKKIVYKKMPNYSASRDLSQLAQTDHVANVRGILYRAQAKQLIVKRNSRYDPKQVQAAVRQMKGVAMKAKAKIRQLEKEEVAEAAQKKAEKKQQEERARQMALELQRKRTARHSREYGQVNEKFPYLYEPLGHRRRMDGKLDEDEEPITMPTVPAAPAPVITPAAPVQGGAPAGGAPVAPSAPGAVGTAPAAAVVVTTMNISV